MRKAGIILVAAAVAAVFAGTSLAEGLRVAVIDVNKVLNDSVAGQAAKKKMEARYEELKKTTPLNEISGTSGNRYSRFPISSLLPPTDSPVLGSFGESSRERNPRMLYGPPRKNRSKRGTSAPPTVGTTCPQRAFHEKTVEAVTG